AGCRLSAIGADEQKYHFRTLNALGRSSDGPAPVGLSGASSPAVWLFENDPEGGPRRRLVGVALRRRSRYGPHVCVVSAPHYRTLCTLSNSTRTASSTNQALDDR